MGSANPTLPVILVTGFAPSPSGPADPSGELLALIAAGPPSSAEVRTQLLPAEPDGALLKAVEAMDRLLPDAVIGLGLAHGSGDLLIERVALNLLERPGGARAAGVRSEPIDAAGPAAYFSTLPVDVMAERLKSGKVPAAVSSSPFTEIGNSLFYALLHYVALRGQETWFQRRPPAGLVSRVGFVRLPLASDRRARMRARETRKSLPLDTTLRGVLLAIDAAAGYLAAETAKLIPS
jgi:pyroglutamyl-peptidase